ncbi:MAG: AMP-binding protein [Bacteroidales bacterium]|nr:AMP-binding protein [Bacteroidales bacterium]
MLETENLTFPALFAETIRKNGERPAMALVGENPITYNELDSKIKALIAMMEKLGLNQGDKIAILSSSIPNWGVSYYAITFMGAIVVPLLPDFHSSEIANILEHSETKAIFISDGLRSKITDIASEKMPLRIRIEDFTLFDDDKETAKIIPDAKPIRQYSVSSGDLAAIIYTSGTTGKSKGVMLTHKNISFTALMSNRVQEINETDKFLSVLPLSHTYENTIGLIFPMTRGACIYYLGKVPTPSILLPALKVIKPTIMLTVPLIIEKVFRNQIKPKFTGNILLRLAIHIPFIRKKINVLAGKKLMETFGGELHFFGIGGAKLNKTVEKFLIEAKFPYAIGYGLTESSPLLAGSNPLNFRLQSTGPAIEGIELIIHNPDKITGEGEIWAKGPNVMLGYYKEPGLTQEILTPDGWLKTGDLGVFDADGYLFIKGRIRNMIVRAGGENIFPEEIESVINNFRHVADSLVFDQKGKLVALVHFNREEIQVQHRHLKEENIDYIEHEIEKLRIELQTYVNHRVNKFSQIQEVIVMPQPFEKTATQKIKRYLYS